ncbi:MAG: hypothetical protein JO165_07510 [Candidatus Eremiobacteraeota bacterium]|nr:hypothetical protein [Candidatus Eremiobacteraeota bacterium]
MYTILLATGVVNPRVVSVGADPINVDVDRITHFVFTADYGLSKPGVDRINPTIFSTHFYAGLVPINDAANAVTTTD